VESSRRFIDLHCHSSASFDSLAKPESIMRAALSRGLTHLAFTTTTRRRGAACPRYGPGRLTVIVGEEVKTPTAT